MESALACGQDFRVLHARKLCVELGGQRVQEMSPRALDLCVVVDEHSRCQLLDARDEFG